MAAFTNLSYCPNNEDIWILWENHGLSACLAYTLFSSILFIWVVTGGSIEWWIYRKYGSPLDHRVTTVRPLYNVQLILTWLLIILLATQVLVSILGVDSSGLSGYQLFWMSLTILSWLFSLHLVRLERTLVLPSVPTGGHGLILLIFWTLALMSESVLFVNLNSPVWFFKLANHKDQIMLGLFISRYLVTLSLFLLGLHAPAIPRQEDYLLGGHIPYTLHISDPPSSTWAGFRSKCVKLFPFLWPRGNLRLQFAVILCMLTLLAGRVINPVIPIVQKYIVDGLSTSNGHSKQFLWKDILLYSSLSFLGQGANSIFANFRSFLWISVQQFSTKKVQVELYGHLHQLSLGWHLSRKTGEILKVLDRGTSSVNTLLSFLLFNIIPAFADIAIAFVFFSYQFNIWFGLIVLVTMITFLAATIFLTEWRTKYRREMNRLDNAAQQRGVDALLNFETVKYYNAEEREIELYSSCVDEYQVAEWSSSSSLCLLNVVQSGVITSGTLTGSLLCAYLIYKDEQNLTAGDYVLFITYIMQLYSPLNFLGTYYRMIQRSFIDMENMFELLDNQPEVVDVPDAKDLQLDQGCVEFRDVCFSYDKERQILKNVSFVVPHGQTVALVGTTGSGKSTLLRLLFRLYEADSGCIMIDGQNISLVKQHSLRSHIGVVPQDTVLFNASIRENIRYGRIAASDEEVEAAATAAEMHESILLMPQGYESIVGERGLKLSGGEKQRVAIARTILKAPDIVLLDEATSALDTNTERNIQRALAEVVTNKTSIVVAHRLSTIVNADHIIVLHHGEIVEQGNHQELLNFNQRYAAMWNQQQQEETDENSKDDNSQRPGTSGQ